MAVNPIGVEKFLRGIDCPAKKEDLVRHTQQQGADQRVLEALRQLPEQTFEGPAGVSKAIGEIDRRSKGSP